MQKSEYQSSFSGLSVIYWKENPTVSINDIQGQSFFFITKYTQSLNTHSILNTKVFSIFQHNQIKTSLVWGSEVMHMEV